MTKNIIGLWEFRVYFLYLATISVMWYSSRTVDVKPRTTLYTRIHPRVYVSHTHWSCLTLSYGLCVVKWTEKHVVNIIAPLSARCVCARADIFISPVTWPLVSVNSVIVKCCFNCIAVLDVVREVLVLKYW